MASGKEIQDAIQRHDSVALRKMAQQAEKEETRMFLNLLADVLEKSVKTLKKTA